MSFLPLSVPAVVRIPFPACPRDSFGRRKREKSKLFLFTGHSRGTEQRSPPALSLRTPALPPARCREKRRAAPRKCKYICRAFLSLRAQAESKGGKTHD